MGPEKFFLPGLIPDNGAFIPSGAVMAASLIDPALLVSRLGAIVGRVDVDSLESCDSTSSELSRRAARGAPAGSVVVADRQSAGRGRRGRDWVSSPEDSLTFSLLWRFTGGFDKVAGLSLAVGVAVARACESLGAAGVVLKWPNDVLAPVPDGLGKLAGILVELSSSRSGTEAIIGIGINLRGPAVSAPGGLAPAGLATLMGAVPERHDLLAALLRELVAVLDRFSRGGFAALADDWQRRHAWQDCPVHLLEEGKVVASGLCRGADGDGALLLEGPDGVLRHLAGDLSLRPL